MRVSVTVQGASEAASELREIDARLDCDLRPTLAARGQDMVTAFRDNILTEGARLADRGIVWPPLHPATRAIRRYYGHEGKKTLVRGGDLLQSIEVLDLGPSHVEVGTRHHAAATVHHGGEVTDERGRRRTVQSFPFVIPSVQDVDDWTTLIADELLGEGGGGAPA